MHPTLRPLPLTACRLAPTAREGEPIGSRKGICPLVLGRNEPNLGIRNEPIFAIQNERNPGSSLRVFAARWV